MRWLTIEEEKELAKKMIELREKQHLKFRQLEERFGLTESVVRRIYYKYSRKKGGL